MNVGLPPRHALPTLPTLRLPFERIASGLGKLPFDRVGTGIARVRIDGRALLERLTIHRGITAEPTPGLGPIRLDRSLATASSPGLIGRLPLHHASAALDRLPLDRLGPIGRIDRKVLAILSVLMLVSFYGLTFTSPASVQQEHAAAAKAAAKPAPKPAAAPTDPFDQTKINSGLRALRKTVGIGDHARSLIVLGDGTLGTTLVRQGSWENVMVRGNDTVIEPLTGAPLGKTELNLAGVHGVAITRLLDRANSVFRLPTAKLASLRLTENPAKPGTFMWTGKWNDAERTTLYADREALSVSTVAPH